MGLFDSESKTAAAIRELRESSFAIERVHAPIPSHAVADALALPKSKVGWFTLFGGIIGFFSGFALAAFTATRWDLIVSGKPVVALVPFFIVGFEFTILFAVFGNVLGIISQARLPSFESYERYDSRVTGDRFGVLASCPPEEQGGLQRFFEAKGAEVKAFPSSKE
jgi:molybdopterin-containing oxidoreductase family membrane subunit